MITSAERITFMISRLFVSISLTLLAFYCIRQGIHYFALPNRSTEWFQANVLGLQLTAGGLGAIVFATGIAFGFLAARTAPKSLNSKSETDKWTSDEALDKKLIDAGSTSPSILTREKYRTHDACQRSKPSDYGLITASRAFIDLSTMIRGDLSDRLIHLTRGESNDLVIRLREATQRFWSIVRGSRLTGSSKDIRGGFKCGCFSEAPIAVLTQMLADQTSRYAPLGVMVDKTQLFSKGGRPAIYQPGDEFGLLPDELQYRHVRYAPLKGQDVTWEREWRIQCDSLELDPAQVTLVVPTRGMVESAKEDYVYHQRNEIWAVGDVAAHSIERFPWHFLVLEDLGLTIDFG